MLGLRLDEPVEIAEVEAALDRDALARLSDLGLVLVEGGMLTLSSRGGCSGERSAPS